MIETFSMRCKIAFSEIYLKKSPCVGVNDKMIVFYSKLVIKYWWDSLCLVWNGGFYYTNLSSKNSKGRLFFGEQIQTKVSKSSVCHGS